MTLVRVVIEVDPELADDGHDSGLTTEGHDQLMSALMSVASSVVTIERTEDEDG